MELGKLEIMFVRHAESMFNLWHSYYLLIKNKKEIPKTINKKDLEIIQKVTSKFDLLLLDPDLSQKGSEMAKTTSSKYSKFPIEIVFVSPLRRAMQTCEAIFQNHPNYKNIKFIVHPLLRELLNNSNDIPNSLSELRKKYEPKYDFSEFEKYPIPYLYFIYDLQSPDKEYLLEKTRGVSENEYPKILQEAEIEKRKKEPKYNQRLESYVNMRGRTKMFKQYLREFIRKNKVDFAKIAVVCHSNFISYSKSEKFLEHGEATFPHIPNCDFTMVDVNKY